MRINGDRAAGTPSLNTSDIPRRRVLLTARQLVETHTALAEALNADQFAIRVEDAWEDLLERSERAIPDIVLVDLDALTQPTSDTPCPYSGPRLVTLLARTLSAHSSALILLTTLDYAEIEDVVHEGVHALISPYTTPAVAIAQINATHTRLRARAARLSGRASQTISTAHMESKQELQGANQADKTLFPEVLADDFEASRFLSR